MQGSEVFVPEEPRVRALFDRAEDLIGRAQWAQAADLLARIAQAALLADGPLAGGAASEEARPAGEDLGPLSSSAVISTGAGLSIGASALVRKLLERLPAEDRERWRELVEPALAENWERTSPGASDSARRVLRRRIIRDHADSKLYRQAIEEEIDETVERGEVALALGACRSLLESGPSFTPEARFRAAVLGRALAALRGDIAGAQEFQAQAESILSSDRAATLDAERVRAARALLSIPPTPTSAPPGRNTAQDFELGSVVWRLTLPERELRLWAAEVAGARSGPGESSSLPDVTLPFFPAARSDTLVFQAYRRVVALRLPGLEEKWTHFLGATTGEVINRMLRPALGPDLVVVSHGDRLVALDMEKGTPRWERIVAYDRGARRLVFLLPGEEPPGPVASVAPPESPPEPPPPSPPDKGPRTDDPKNPGGNVKGEEKRPERAPLVSLTSPVIAGGAVVFAASVRVQDETQIYAVCLDRAGNRRWATGLGAYRSGDYLGQIAHPTPPLVHAPRVFVPTNLGAVAAVDLVDGAVLWIRQYPRLHEAGRVEAVKSRRRWGPNPLVIWSDGALHHSIPPRGDGAPQPPGVDGPSRGQDRDMLLLAPQDSNLLFALSPADGAVRWELPRDRHSSLVGVHEERCYLGGSRLSAIELVGPRAGTIAWRWQSGGALSLGCALLEGGRLLVSENEALVQLDARSGRVLSTTLWDFRGGGGNLLLLGGLLAAAGPGELLVYEHHQRALERAASFPEEDRLLQTAKANLKSGDRKAAFEALTSWANLRPPDPPANSPLYRLRFELAEIAAHWIGRSADLGEDELVLLHHYRVLLEPLSERKLVAAIDAARARREAGDFSGAIAHLEDALKITLSPALGPPSPPGTVEREATLAAVPYPVNDFLTIPSTEAIRDQILLIRDEGAAGQAAFARFEDRAEEALREAQKIGTQPAFRRVIEGYPFTLAALQARRDLVEYLLNQQNPSEAIRCLLDLLWDHPEAEDFLAIKLRVVDLLVEVRRYSEAREVLLSLLRERPDDVVDGPVEELGSAREPLTVRQAVESRLLDPHLRDARRGSEASPLRFPLRKRWRSPANLASSTRLFLRPDGARPEHLAGTFFTRSREAIECRRVSDGYPLWTVELALVPGFMSGFAGAGFFFSSPPRMQARFCGDLLVVQDARNVLAIETRTGRISWQKPFGRQEELSAHPPAPGPPAPGPAEAGPGRPPAPAPGEKGRGRIQPLSEMVRGFTGGSEAIYLTTSRRRLLSLGLDGARRWDRQLDFEPASEAAPELSGGEVVVFQEAPVAAHFFDAARGDLLARVEVQGGADARLIQRPLVRPDRMAFLAMPGGLEILNLSTRKVRGTYRPGGVLVQKAWSFSDLPDQVVLHIGARGLPALVGVDIQSGRELWRYDKFPGRTSELSVHCDGSHLYVIHGEDRWSLLLIELRSGPERGRYSALPLWPNEIAVGTFFSREAERQILISEDAIFVPDASSSSVNVYDKLKGSNRSALASPITRFLVDKRSSRFGMDIVDNVLVVLTEGGDCGFDAQPLPGEAADPWAKTLMVKRFSEKPDDWDNVGRLAGRFFIDGDEETALTLLNRALLSEGLPSLESPGRYQYLSYLLSGIKEEAMKEPKNRLNIACRRFRSPPMIDGELNDSWNYTSRVEMRTLRQVGATPSPGQSPDVWAGEDDLSATLYTGWDEEHFYFALDVEDSQIFPYDKGAEFWKGDCLIIGVDPTADGGFFQRGDDQLLTLALTVPKRKLAGKGKDGDQDDEDDESQKPKGLFSVKKKDDNSGVVYEVGMPWSSFGGDDSTIEPPLPGKRFGLSLLLTDDDTGQGATKTLSPNPCHLLPRDPKRIWRFLIPEYFPRVTLE